MARISTLRCRPPGLAGGIRGAIHCHWASVRSEEYGSRDSGALLTRDSATMPLFYLLVWLCTQALSDLPYAYGKDLDDDRRVDYAANSEVVGIELLGMNEGVHTDDLPQRDAIIRVLEEHKIPLYA